MHMDTYSLRQISIQARRLSLGYLSSAMVIPFPAALLFQSLGRKMLPLHPQSVVKQVLHQLTENTNRRCVFQANRQKYPHLLPGSMAFEVKGRCLLLSMAAASDDDELQISLCRAPRLIRQDTGQLGFF